MPQDLILIRPRRGHQSRHLGRWVRKDEDPYECPADEADRLVRHGVAERVNVDLDSAAMALVDDDTLMSDSVSADENDDEEVVS